MITGNIPFPSAGVWKIGGMAKALILTILLFIAGREFILHACAETPPSGDPCAIAMRAPPKPSVERAGRLRLQRESALFIIYHLQLACRRLDAFASGSASRGDEAQETELRKLSAFYTRMFWPRSTANIPI